MDASNVLVLYNNASAEGIQIANYYAQIHPGVRLLGLDNVPTSEQITQDVYRNVIRPQVLGALDSSISQIVTTKGLPLRIYNDQTPAWNGNSYTYTDPQGVSRTMYTSSYKVYSSLESELTRVSTFSSWKQMGDQTWWYPSPTNPSVNPYFKANGSFTPSAGNDYMRLTARLDGYTVNDVKAALDRARNVFVVPFGHDVVVDDSPNGVAHSGTTMASLATSVLPTRGQSVLYDTGLNPVLSDTKPVIGYVSHGTNDGSGQLQPDYMQSQLTFSLAKGAIAHTWESYSGYTFTEGASHSQGLIADWLRAGGTAGIAHVEEPGANKNSVTNEDQLFDMMLQGRAFGEAAWSATPQLSFVNTVIGDPLMVWRTWLPGDSNLDGTVNLSDYAQLRAHWLQASSFAGGDFNGDGIVNLSDYAILRSNWLRTAITSLTPITTSFIPVPPPPDVVPEPSTAAIAIASIAGLLHRRFRTTKAH